MEVVLDAAVMPVVVVAVDAVALLVALYDCSAVSSCCIRSARLPEFSARPEVVEAELDAEVLDDDIMLAKSPPTPPMPPPPP